MKIKWLFNRKELRDFEMENQKLRQERDDLKNLIKLKEKDNIAIGNKVVVALEEIKELKKENRRLKKQLKEVK